MDRGSWCDSDLIGLVGKKRGMVGGGGGGGCYCVDGELAGVVKGHVLWNAENKTESRTPDG